MLSLGFLIPIFFFFTGFDSGVFFFLEVNRWRFSKKNILEWSFSTLCFCCASDAIFFFCVSCGKERLSAAVCVQSLQQLVTTAAHVQQKVTREYFDFSPLTRM
jgi:hypothetical protein